MAEKREYRVTWQREGQSGRRRLLYQTLAGAERCAKRQETASEEMTWLDEHPSFNGRPKPITFGPTIEVRSVGEWAVVEAPREGVA